MARWLYCQSCKQWSKSSTPLAEDKVCPFCSEYLVKVKTLSSLLPAGSAENEEEARVMASVSDADEGSESSALESAVQDTGAAAEEPKEIIKEEPRVRSRVLKGQGTVEPALKEPEVKIEEAEAAAVSDQEKPADLSAEAVPAAELDQEVAEADAEAEAEAEIEIEVKVEVEVEADDPEPEAEVAAETLGQESEVVPENQDKASVPEPAGEEPVQKLREPDVRVSAGVAPEIKFSSERKDALKKSGRFEAVVALNEVGEIELAAEPNTESEADEAPESSEGETAAEAEQIEAEGDAEAESEELIDDAVDADSADGADEAADEADEVGETDEVNEEESEPEEPGANTTEKAVKAKPKNIEPEAVKVSEVRVVTDRIKKDRQVKKTRR